MLTGTVISLPSPSGIFVSSPSTTGRTTCAVNTLEQRRNFEETH